MIGAFAYLGPRARDVAARHAACFARHPWTCTSTFADERAVVSTFHHEGGVGGPLLVEEDRVVLLSGWFLARGRAVVDARAAARALDAGDVPHGVEAGTFVLLVLDRREGTLRAWTDRFGARPLHVLAADGEAFASTRADAVAALAARTPRPDPRGVLDRLTFGFVAGLETPWQGVALSPPAADLALAPGRAHQAAWWRPRFQADAREIDARGRDLARAVKRCLARIAALPQYAKAVLPLSGGLDSRTVFALADPRPPTFTFGAPGTPDRVLARRVVEVARSEAGHLEFDVPAGDEAALVAMLDGAARPNAPQVPTLLAGVRERGHRLLLDPFLGDGFLGGSYHSSPRASARVAARDVARAGRETPYDAGLARAAIARSLLADVPDATLARFGDRARAHVRRRAAELVALAERRSGRPEHVEDAIDLVQAFYARGRRSVGAVSRASCAYVDVAFPFLDPGVMDEVFAAPPSQRSFRRLYRRLHRLLPFADLPATSLEGATVRIGDRARVFRAYVHAGLRRFGR